MCNVECTSDSRKASSRKVYPYARLGRYLLVARPLVANSFKSTGLLSVPDAVIESSIERCAWLVSSYDGDFSADFSAPSCLALSAARALAIPVRERGTVQQMRCMWVRPRMQRGLTHRPRKLSNPPNPPR